ncbi:MAG: hypothetical protein B6A08_07245 [Sorangiineae bacterium NIC37A_2]|nr:MAG: hypothetical protein B6A08_07245 [Sorangiineae bacterium NIC37A_2]
MRRLAPIILAALGSALLGCHVGPPDEGKAVPVLEPKRTLVVPEGYQGPIDPEWPPRRVGSLEVELAASRLLREALEANPDMPNEELAEMQRGLHVEKGKIGAFHYLEVIVGNMRHPDDKLPLVILLHGRGNRPRVPATTIDSPVPFRMFIPQAPDPLGDGFTWLAVPTLADDAQLFTRSLSGRADQLAPAIEAFMRLRPTLGKPILVGFSQGAIMSFALATRYPTLFAAAFPMAGWLPPELYPTPKTGAKYPYFFAQHGGSDTVVPTARGRATVKALRARGLQVDYREAPGVSHVVSADMADGVRRGVRRILASYTTRVRRGPAPRPRG